MKIWTQTTIIQDQARLRRERLLPQPGEVVVTPGQEVSPVQVVARTRRATRFHIVPAGELWRLPPAAVQQHLLVSVGTEVQTGDPLLQQKRLLGTRMLEAPVDGTFNAVDQGRLVLQQHEWFELRALVSARVVNAIPNRGCVLEIVGTQIQGIWGSGKESYGKLKIMVDHERSPLNLEQVSVGLEGTVPVAGTVNQSEVLRVLQQRGASGLITGSLSARLLQQAQQLSFPVIVTDGIGHQGMNHEAYFLLRKHAEGDVALFARDPDYWGNRPEIIIPHEAGAATLPSATSSLRALAPGQKIRILRAPLAGQIGEIVRLGQWQRSIGIGTRVQGADVRLANGTVLFVPYANLDTIV